MYCAVYTPEEKGAVHTCDITSVRYYYAPSSAHPSRWPAFAAPSSFDRWCTSSAAAACVPTQAFFFQQYFSEDYIRRMYAWLKADLARACCDCCYVRTYA